MKKPKPEKPTTQQRGEVVARKVADAAKKIVPDDCLFAVLIFGGQDENGTGWTAYCSTGKREDIANAMQEHIEKVLAN